MSRYYISLDSRGRFNEDNEEQEEFDYYAPCAADVQWLANRMPNELDPYGDTLWLCACDSDGDTFNFMLLAQDSADQEVGVSDDQGRVYNGSFEDFVREHAEPLGDEDEEALKAALDALDEALSLYRDALQADFDERYGEGEEDEDEDEEDEA